jgi:HEAT repeat protein
MVSNRARLRRIFRWAISVILVVLGLTTTWAWGRVAQLAEPSPEDAGPQTSAVYAAWQAAGAVQPTLFRSLDGGVTWQPLALPEDRVPSVWASDGGDRLAVFSNEGMVFRSEDQGDTWTSVDMDLPILSLAWDETGSLYLGSDGYGLYRLAANGTLVAVAPSGSELAASPVRHLAHVDGRLYAATPSVLFSTDDGGETWAKSLPVSAGQIAALAATDRDSVFVGTQTEGVYRSSDGGRTWQPASEGLGLAAGQMVKITALQADPQEPGVLYVALDYVLGATELHATAVGTFVTVDNGARWQPLVGPTWPEAMDASALVVPANRPLYVQSVAETGLQVYAPDVEGALAALGSGDPQVRIDASRMLGLARAEDAGTALVSTLADPDPAVSMAAAQALGRLNSPATANALLVSLDHPDEHVRLGAARALGWMKIEAAVDPLRTMLLNGEEAEIGTAAEALGRIGSPTAIDALLVALNDVDMTARRHAALAALESIGEPAVGPLTGMLKDPDAYSRSNAAEALGWIGSPSATRALVSALGDKSSLVRQQAVRALGEIGDPAARTALARVQQRDESPVVQAEAGRSLARIEQEPVRTAGWLANVAPTLNRLQALRWLILGISLAGAALLAATNTRLATLPVFQQTRPR